MEIQRDLVYTICVPECVLSKDPGHMFGYRRLDIDKDVQYYELPSEESGVDTCKTAMAPGSSTTITQSEEKARACLCIYKRLMHYSLHFLAFGLMYFLALYNVLIGLGPYAYSV